VPLDILGAGDAREPNSMTMPLFIVTVMAFRQIPFGVDTSVRHTIAKAAQVRVAGSSPDLRHRQQWWGYLPATIGILYLRRESLLLGRWMSHTPEPD
jgi:hypothetical protein